MIQSLISFPVTTPPLFICLAPSRSPPHLNLQEDSTEASSRPPPPLRLPLGADFRKVMEEEQGCVCPRRHNAEAGAVAPGCSGGNSWMAAGLPDAQRPRGGSQTCKCGSVARQLRQSTWIACGDSALVVKRT